jgi:hypothetical protein
MKLHFSAKWIFGIICPGLIHVACGDETSTVAPSADSDAADSDEVDAAPDIDLADTAGSEDTFVTDAASDTSQSADTFGPPREAPCDPLDPSHCMLPFPSNLYLREDPTRVTGVTLDFGQSLPRNTDGTPIDSAPFRRLDGYGVGTPVIVSFPNLGWDGLPTEYDTSRALAPDAQILWFEVTDSGLERIPFFADDDISEVDPAARLLILRPGVILKEATRYIVAFRDLRDRDGRLYEKSEAFAKLVAGDTTTDPGLAPRQLRFDDTFALLEEDAGIGRASLQLAWDFTTASCDALHGPVRHMVADAFAATGDSGPTLGDIEVETLDHAHWALEIRGTIEVPHFMKTAPMLRNDGAVWVFNNGPDGLPAVNGTRKAPFWARIPKSALAADHPAHGLVLYGHGQNGSGTQVRSGSNAQIANENHLIFFATDMWGMSEEDVPGIIDMLSDFSYFPRLADRLQQGLLNHVLLARSFKDRFAELESVKSRGIVIDASRLYYSGISQGGIYGPSVVALSPDIQRGHLGVPGNNYSFLLSRSRNFAPFFIGVSAFYTERWAQVLLLQVIEQIWEQSDSVSYYRHLGAEPFDGQGPNHVLLAPAKGDVQVAVTSNEWVARSGLGIPVMTPYDTERSAPTGAETAVYPRTGSGLVLYDFGNPWPDESKNLPPTSDTADPHGAPRGLAAHNRQLVHFLETGEILDVCSDDAVPGCRPD